MERRWTKDLLAQILFTVRECTMLERLVQREMRRGQESVLEPSQEWTVLRHAAMRARYKTPPNDNMPECTGFDYQVIRDALSEIERLQVLVSRNTIISLKHQVDDLRDTLKLRNDYTQDRQETIDRQDARIARLESKSAEQIDNKIKKPYCPKCGHKLTKHSDFLICDPCNYWPEGDCTFFFRRPC